MHNNKNNNRKIPFKGCKQKLSLCKNRKHNNIIIYVQ